MNRASLLAPVPGRVEFQAMLKSLLILTGLFGAGGIGGLALFSAIF
jgi:hypothetical protein